MSDGPNKTEQSPESGEGPPVQPNDVQPNDAQPNDAQPKNPLHGVKLADMLEHLVKNYGWQELGDRINIRCFTNDPSIKSSLKFLRRTPWARDKVERLYLRSIGRRDAR